jgi:hypothetical protein
VGFRVVLNNEPGQNGDESSNDEPDEVFAVGFAHGLKLIL